MSFLHRSALAWAEGHSLAADVRWAQLEVMAFRKHPEIFQHFGEDGAAIAERERRAPETPRSRTRGVRTALAVIVILIAFFTPIAGGAVIVGDRFDFYRIDAERAVPASAIIFVIAAIAQAVYLVVWLVERAYFTWVHVGIYAVGVVFAGLALWVAPAYSAVDGYDAWPQYQAPAIVSLAIAGLGLIAGLVRFHSRPPEVPEQVVQPTGAPEGDVRDLIAALPEDERRAIAADRDAALDMLRMRMTAVAVGRRCPRARARGEASSLPVRRAARGAGAGRLHPVRSGRPRSQWHSPRTVRAAADRPGDARAPGQLRGGVAGAPLGLSWDPRRARDRVRRLVAGGEARDADRSRSIA